MGEVAFAEIDAEFDGKEGCEFSQVCDGMFFDVGAELPMCISIIYLFFIFVLFVRKPVVFLQAMQSIICTLSLPPPLFFLEPPSTFDMKQTYILPTTQV